MGNEFIDQIARLSDNTRTPLNRVESSQFSILIMNSMIVAKLLYNIFYLLIPKSIRTTKKKTKRREFKDFPKLFAMPLVSLITRKWSCGCNEQTDRLLQNFSTSKHARRRNAIPFSPPFHSLPLRVYNDPYFSSFTLRDSRPILLNRNRQFSSTEDSFLGTSFHKKQFRRIRCTFSLQCFPLTGQILFE